MSASYHHFYTGSYFFKHGITRQQHYYHAHYRLLSINHMLIVGRKKYRGMKECKHTLLRNKIGSLKS